MYVKIAVAIVIYVLGAVYWIDRTARGKGLLGNIDGPAENMKNLSHIALAGLMGWPFFLLAGFFFLLVGFVKFIVYRPSLTSIARDAALWLSGLGERFDRWFDELMSKELPERYQSGSKEVNLDE